MFRMLHLILDLSALLCISPKINYQEKGLMAHEEGNPEEYAELEQRSMIVLVGY